MTSDPLSHPNISRRHALGLLLAGTVSARDSVTHGPAFHYQAIFTPDKEAWYTRFPLLVTGNILSEKQSQNLRVNGTKLIAYVWTSAFYPGDAVSAPLDWQARVRQHRADWLLNKEPQEGGAAASGKAADWYDFGNAELVTQRAHHLAKRLSEASYDGYFFDTLGSAQLPKPVLAEFQKRHPGQDYDMGQGSLLRELRKQLAPGKLIFTNQGYRNPDAFLPHADLDLSESYFAAELKGATKFLKWHDPDAPWSSIKTPVERLILPALRSHPHVRFVHLNYAAGQGQEIQRAISYSYACAKLFNHDSYLVSPEAYGNEKDEIYFSDLGKPVSPYREQAEQGVVWREYERGVVAINCGLDTASLPYHGLKLADPPRGYVFR